MCRPMKMCKGKTFNATSALDHWLYLEAETLQMWQEILCKLTLGFCLLREKLWNICIKQSIDRVTINLYCLRTQTLLGISICTDTYTKIVLMIFWKKKKSLLNLQRVMDFIMSYLYRTDVVVLWSINIQWFSSICPELYFWRILFKNFVPLKILFFKKCRGMGFYTFFIQGSWMFLIPIMKITCCKLHYLVFQTATKNCYQWISETVVIM